MAKSKSAYSVPGKLGKFNTHIIVVWVDKISFGDILSRLETSSINSRRSRILFALGRVLEKKYSAVF